MIALFTIIWLLAATLGGGAIILKLTNTLQDFQPGEVWAWCFLLGMGLIGWLGFFLAQAGLIQPLQMAVAIGALIPGTMFLSFRPAFSSAKRFCAVEKGLLALIFAVLAGDIIEGFPPPTDADTLAYHFANVKYFLNEGSLKFIPRANTGAIPMLQHMTYLSALSIGGERALTLWVSISGWLVGGLTFYLARRHISRSWSLALALVVLSTPAVVYGAGTGQVEVRNAAFVLAAAYAIAECIRTGKIRFAVLAGLMAGFYVGSKYPGLLFAAACGAMLLFHRNRLSLATVFSLTVCLAGGQWYFWNWLHTGDPVFPMLYAYLPYLDDVSWPSEQAQYYVSGHAALGEYGAPRTLPMLFLYPLWATFNPLTIFESGRVGFGPFVVFVLPFMLLGAWVFRKTIRNSKVLIYAVLCGGAYAGWFFLGPSLRVRFLLPLYPLLVVIAGIASVRAVEFRFYLLKPLAAAFFITFTMQITGHAIFTLRPALYMFSQETRDDYLRQAVGRYAAVDWINRTFEKNRKVFFSFRNLAYLLDVPSFNTNHVFEARIVTRPDFDNPKQFWRQLLRQGITDVIYNPLDTQPREHSGMTYLLWKLRSYGCLQEIYRENSVAPVSRTLPFLGRIKVVVAVYSLSTDTCRIK